MAPGRWGGVEGHFRTAVIGRVGIRSSGAYIQPITPLEMPTPHIPIIPKERIPSLRFPRQPLAMTDEQRREIQQELANATRLGNTEHGKCRIVFEDDEGVKAVETTIWTFDPDNIVLKYGTTIPVARVISVSIP
jgi:hypothetical protein